MAKTVRLKIHRQDNSRSASHFDTFEIPYRENMNVISALMEIRKNPVTDSGKAVVPPAWEAACLEEVCGSCSMNINGRARQACTALIEEVATEKGDRFEVTLEPLKKFELIRDLMVDRTRMFNNLIKVKAWVPIDGSYDLGMAPPQDDEIRKLRYDLSRCMTCGCCLEACPQFGSKSLFMGPQALGQALLFNLHGVGSTLEPERLEAITEEDGITNCGKRPKLRQSVP